MIVVSILLLRYGLRHSYEMSSDWPSISEGVEIETIFGFALSYASPMENRAWTMDAGCSQLRHCFITPIFDCSRSISIHHESGREQVLDLQTSRTQKREGFDYADKRRRTNSLGTNIIPI